MSLPEANPNQALFLLGVNACLQGEWEEAFRRFVTVIGQAPAWPEPYHNLGVVYWHQGDTESAQKSWEKALSLRPRFVEALIGLGLANLTAGRQHEGLRCMERAVAISSRAESFNALGVALFCGAQVEDASRCFEKAVSVDSTLSAPLRNLATLFRARGQDAEAQHCLSRAALARDLSGFSMASLYVSVPIARRIGEMTEEEYDAPEAIFTVYDLDEPED